MPSPAIGSVRHRDLKLVPPAGSVTPSPGDDGPQLLPVRQWHDGQRCLAASPLFHVYAASGSGAGSLTCFSADRADGASTPTDF
ncbi:hypothetical protein ACGH2B_12075 [Streptomyces sp. BBFR2]|uniref:hypothetical protein n=1 Tax=Streptomyces sp. BBFR2 TaxID=3372854 RepID=UPI0037D9CDF5